MFQGEMKEWCVLSQTRGGKGVRGRQRFGEIPVYQSLDYHTSRKFDTFWFDLRMIFFAASRMLLLRPRPLEEVTVDSGIGSKTWIVVSAPRLKACCWTRMA
jgi:hypothetical protein